MNFRQATDALMKSVTLDDLAKEMGVSLQTLRQARTTETSTAYRSAPRGWEASVRKLAQSRAAIYQKLANRL